MQSPTPLLSPLCPCCAPGYSSNLVYTLEEKTLKKLLQMSVDAAGVDTQMLALRAAPAPASGANGE